MHHNTDEDEQKNDDGKDGDDSDNYVATMMLDPRLASSGA